MVLEQEKGHTFQALADAWRAQLPLPRVLGITSDRARQKQIKTIRQHLETVHGVTDKQVREQLQVCCACCDSTLMTTRALRSAHSSTT
jgi:hypothetical protein